MARKPISEKNIAANCVKWGTGAINIDATRVPMTEGDKFDIRVYKENQNNEKRDTELTDIEYGEYTVSQPNELGRFPANVLGEIPDYQKYFYSPKVSRKERHIGWDLTKVKTGDNFGDGLATGIDIMKKAKTGEQGNNHPTVKPIELMKYLIKLVTPQGGKVLDPFNGSGSTGCAAVELGYEYTGIELDPKYVEIARKRIEAWNTEHALPEGFEYE
jgi:site-specific DNA-methyltransferase (adenine-specific)